jgi:hypothetical protein
MKTQFTLLLSVILAVLLSPIGASAQTLTTEKMLQNILGTNTSSGYAPQATAANALVDSKRNVVLNGNGAELKIYGAPVTVGDDASEGTLASEGKQALTSSATISVSPQDTVSMLTLTPAHTATLNAVAAAGVVGRRYTLVITTSGTTGYTLTFGTAFKSTGTLATGTTTAKVFAITFAFDGTNFNEVSRTTAM